MGTGGDGSGNVDRNLCIGEVVKQYAIACKESQQSKELQVLFEMAEIDSPLLNQIKT